MGINKKVFSYTPAILFVAKWLKGGRNILKVIFYFAGVIAQGLNTRTVRVMKETEVNIFQHFSKDIESLIDISFDYVVTMCRIAK